jgi:hypothetical protein
MGILSPYSRQYSRTTICTLSSPHTLMRIQTSIALPMVTVPTIITNSTAEKAMWLKMPKVNCLVSC